MSNHRMAHVPMPWRGVARAGAPAGVDANGVALGRNTITDADGVEHDVLEQSPNVWHCITHDARA